MRVIVILQRFVYKTEVSKLYSKLREHITQNKRTHPQLKIERQHTLDFNIFCLYIVFGFLSTLAPHA